MEMFLAIITVVMVLSGLILLVVGVGEYVGSLISRKGKERAKALKMLLVSLVLLLASGGLCSLLTTS